MPTNKKGGQNGGMQGQSQGRDVGGQIREGAEAVAGRFREGYDSAREGVARGYRRAEGTIARNPAPSVLLSFGLGFGLGVALVSLFGREEETWADRYIPDRLRDLPDSLRPSMKQASRQAHHMADAIRNVPDHVSHLADAIASHLPHAIKKHLG
jgi:hypothetical protein